MKSASIKFDDLNQVASQILNLSQNQHVVMIAIAGAPGSGKSTIGENLHNIIGEKSCLIPMDGFHLDNIILRDLGLISVKGAPETFDLTNFARLIDKAKNKNLARYPLFDRNRDSVIEDGGKVSDSACIFLFEGNYLLFNEAGWSDLAKKWDASIWLDVSLDVIEERLIARWIEHGLSENDAIARARSNDLANAKRIINKAIPANWIFKNH